MRGPLNLHAREQSAGTQGKNQHTYLPGNASFHFDSIKGAKNIYFNHLFVPFRCRLLSTDFNSQNGIVVNAP